MTLYRVIYEARGVKTQVGIYGANPKQARQVFENWMQAQGIAEFQIERVKIV